jgi:predicted transglutaminase-like cysteine proteinase
MAFKNRTVASASTIASAITLAGSLLLPVNQSLAAGPASMSMRLETAIHTMTEGGRSLAPFAFVKFCAANPDQCEDTGGEQTARLDDKRRNELVAVNRAVNRAIRPKHDAPGKDSWRVDVAAGDCEDYALTKKKRLMQLGWSSRALRIAVVTTGSGEGHAVLVAKTSAGDFVLDNRFDRIKNWRNTDLRWIKIQSAENPKVWRDLGTGNDFPVVLARGESLDRQYDGPATADAQTAATQTAVSVAVAQPAKIAVSDAMPATLKIDLHSRVKVVDGATFQLDGNRYRLAGVKTTMRNELCRDAKGFRYACGLQKAKALSDMLRSGPVQCQIDQNRAGLKTVNCTIGNQDLATLLERAVAL